MPEQTWLFEQEVDFGFPAPCQNKVIARDEAFLDAKTENFLVRRCGYEQIVLPFLDCDQEEMNRTAGLKNDGWRQGFCSIIVNYFYSVSG